MKRFILIDQSIKDSGGHHLEYALRVLKAAKKKGFKTILGVHKDCEDISSEHIDVVEKGFTHTFWENLQSEYTILTSGIHKFIKGIIATKNQLLCGLMGSSLGSTYYMASVEGLSLLDILERYGTITTDRRISAGKIFFGYTLFKLSRFREKLSTSVILVISRRIVQLVLVSMGAVVGVLCSLILLPYILVRQRGSLVRSDSYAKQFAMDIQRLLVRANAESGDLVFIPTLGNIELVGVALAVRKLQMESLSWHFLFRRNIFHGREPSYQDQINSQFKTLQAFLLCKSMVYKEKAIFNFYTDTNALTDQYKRLGVFRFTTLPIPLDGSLNRLKQSDKKPINISYIGDARDEKGYPLLARMVDDLRAAGFSRESVHYTFQSNFNVPDGELGSRIAKAELAAEPNALVDLLEGPFESQEYTNLVNQADILLIPYNASNYYARSSGIFAEAIVAGTPFVATDKSWMSQELFEVNQRYYRDLLKTQPKLQSVTLENLQAHSRFVIHTHPRSDVVWLLVKISQLTARPGVYAHIRWKSSPEIVLVASEEAVFFRQFTVDLRSENSYALLRLPKKERFLLEFDLDDGRGNVMSLCDTTVYGISVQVHEMDIDSTVPLFKGGTFYCINEDFLAAVAEVVTRYAVYSRDIEEITTQWKGFHSSDVLVNRLSEGIQ
ncbi:glycosyltransferase [Candidatus Thiosymbion oneisti]|uniref:glycosyltransferase n=1 Tax=Candidatus Thiosymbion oneisti TaxID=589554 RepID=UPI001061F71F|nr:glycosyltransferase [Candidatus Thiosymbion oneisti]